MKRDELKIIIPTPKFVVFYNGVEKRPAKEIQRLSDMYKHDGDIQLELTCTVYNINPGYNEGIQEKSLVLSGYTQFIEKVRDNLAKGYESPVESAVQYCIDNDILGKFFSRNKDEVIKNMTIDMTHERQLELERKESYSDGFGKGKLEQLIELARDNLLDVSIAAKKAGMSEGEFKSLL